MYNFIYICKIILIYSIMKQLFLLFIFALLLNSCRENSDDILILSDGVADVEELDGIEHDIMVNILSSRYGGYQKGRPATRAVAEVSLTPYVENGDTLLFVAQYKDGWEVYSTCHAVDMVPFSSDTGIFSLDDPDMPKALKDLIIETAKDFSQISRDNVEVVHPSWKTAVVDEEDLKQGYIIEKGNGKTKAISYSEAPTGRWTLLKSEVISESTYNSPKLTITKWDQGSPWNKYSKYFINNENKLVPAVAGCEPVAIAQYLYYTHSLTGIPATTVDSAIPIDNGCDFTFTGNSSNAWNLMAVEYGYSVSGLNESAIFIGHIGRLLNAKYSLEDTSVPVTNKISLLNDIFKVSFSHIDFDVSYVIRSLNEKYPVLTDARTNKKVNGDSQSEAGHLFLIDRYKQNIRKIKYTYGLIRDPWTGPGPDPFMSDKVDENGNILQYAYTKEMEQTFTESSVAMNWGYSGYYDDTYWSPHSDDWSAGGHVFNLSHKIYKRSDIK